ncbi:MAG: CHAD domain-containing protein [Acidobacteriota bacterium]|nr:CHAD domain-containing protein [Acidobacteriota bacterium]
MSGRGELVGFAPPLEPARAALSGDYSVQPAADGGLALRDTREKLVCRISVYAAPGGSFWLTLAPLRGYSADASRIRRRLLAAGFLSEEGWKSAAVPMAAAERADVAVARVLLRLQELQDANLPGTLADADPEFLHDLRVAIRRTRSVLRQMRGVFARDDLERARGAFKWLQSQTGPTRDLDVYLQEFEQLRALAPDARQADLSPLEPLLRERHRRARAAMEQALSSERAGRLRRDWGELLGTLVARSEDGRPDATRPIAALAAERIRKVHRQMVRMGAAITLDSVPAQYHELRKKGKELRYLLELFGLELFDPEVVRPLIRALKSLQDVLGLHQDREIQIAMLTELGDELVSQPGGAGALIAIGTLIDRLEAEARAARRRFAAAFTEFASAAQCKLVAREFK